jgi:hypothetical protein
MADEKDLGHVIDKLKVIEMRLDKFDKIRKRPTKTLSQLCAITASAGIQTFAFPMDPNYEFCDGVNMQAITIDSQCIVSIKDGDGNYIFSKIPAEQLQANNTVNITERFKPCKVSSKGRTFTIEISRIDGAAFSTTFNPIFTFRFTNDQDFAL